MSAHELITDHLDLWTQAITQKSTAGRGSNGKIELTGIKKLRELILELAVRGKLLTQDSGDECASMLLNRIKGIEQELIKSKRVRKPKHLASVSSEEVGFTLPSSWQWVRLGTIGQIVGGGTPKSGEPSYWSDKGIPWLTPADLYGLKEKYVASGKRDISELGLAKSSAQLLPTGSVLFSSRAPIGYVAITTGDLATNQGFKSCVPYVQEMNQFIYYFLKRSAPYIDASASGTTFKEISGTKVASIPMPLPPLAEQHRIVQKVDELMALCDRLEQHTSDQLDAHVTLVDTLLGTLTQSANASELADNWARLAEHFDTLFITEQSIDKFKQTILQLAVMGRLVERVESDTPVSKTLEMVANEQNKLTRERKIKKPKQQMPIVATDKPFRIPSHWRWMRFGQLVTDFANGLYKPAKFYSSKGTISLRMFNIQDGSITLEGARRVEIDDKELIQYRLAPGDILINRVNSKELVGKAAIVPDSEEPMVFESMNMRARLLINFTKSRYINLVLRSGFVKNYLLSLAKEAIGQASLNQTQISSIMIPLPPIEEQHRIVQKVDELMALCDHLKDHLNQASDTRCQLAGAVVEGALN